MPSNLRPGTKALMYQGRKVADVEMSGDVAVDLEKCRKVLKDLGLYEPTTKLQAMHRQAHSFAICAIRIHDALLQKERNFAAASPFVVNAAFSLEVYLKALTECFGGNFKGIHDLAALLQNLPSSAQMAIKVQLPFVMTTEELRLGYDLAAILQDLNKAFVDWRYLYEDGKQLEAHYPQVLYALRVLHAASFYAIVSTTGEKGRAV